MYYYYYATAGGAKIWVSMSIRQFPVETRAYFKLISAPQWKKYLTTMQITQFVIDLLVTYFACKFSSLCEESAPTDTDLVS